jgi:vesicle-associated membrane protein 7
MSLLHALVASNTTVLAEAHGPSVSHDPEQGSQFSQATATILSKIPPNNSKLSYQLEDYLCHYIRQDGEWAAVAPRVRYVEAIQPC